MGNIEGDFEKGEADGSRDALELITATAKTWLYRMENQTMKNLMKPENEAEANVIKSVLEEHGIYAEIRSFHDTAYDGLFQSQYGWGVIRVSERDFPEAQRIIEEWNNSSPGELPWKNKQTNA
jgi:hypothetical protein